MVPFPFDLWLVAISRSLRWLMAYEPPPPVGVTFRYGEPRPVKPSEE